MCLGEQICDQQGWSFDSVFRHQFRLGRTPSISSRHWKKRALGSYWIEHCPHLPATKVLNRRGRLIGWCLGIAVDAAGNVFGHSKGGPITVAATFDAIERRQSQMAGRFAMLIQIGDEVRYYPDAASGLTAVAYDKMGVIASTVTLAIDDAVQPWDGRSVAETQSQPTLGLMDETADMRVRQLFGNHYLDLATFTSHRFWPKEDTPFEPAPPLARSVAQITDRLQSIMTALVTHFDCNLPITGGQDSRMLAGAVPVSAVDHVGVFYVHEINWSTSFDVRSAVQVAQHLKVPLGIKRILNGHCDEDLADFNLEEARAQISLATGFGHPHLDRVVLQAMHVAPSAELLLRGGAGEMVRANKYPQVARTPPEITPDFAFQRFAGNTIAELTKQFGETKIERYRKKYEDWYYSLPVNARSRAIDLAHIELWLAGKTGSVFYAPRKHFYVNPFSERMLLHRVMRCDPKLRKRGLLVKKLLDRFSPGLSDVVYAGDLKRQNARLNQE